MAPNNLQQLVDANDPTHEVDAKRDVGGPAQEPQRTGKGGA
jgi:hypothetical protein